MWSRLDVHVHSALTQGEVIYSWGGRHNVVIGQKLVLLVIVEELEGSIVGGRRLESLQQHSATAANASLNEQVVFVGERVVVARVVLVGRTRRRVARRVSITRGGSGTYETVAPTQLGNLKVAHAEVLLKQWERERQSFDLSKPQE